MPFDEAMIQKVWEKAGIAPGKDPALYRVDKCGALIKRDMYRKTESCSMGWEINPIKPLSLGGTHDLANLQALQWENNLHKKNNEILWSCRVTYKQEGNTYLV